MNPFVLKTIDAVKMKTAFPNFRQSIENEKNRNCFDCSVFDLLLFANKTAYGKSKFGNDQSKRYDSHCQ